MNKPSKWIVVTDFDGTLARKDVGDELCREALGKRFDELLAKYRGGDSNLLEYQGEVWPNFPMPEPLFRERSRFHGELRPGVGEFLRKCRARNIPVYVASCGVVTYIESVLDAHLSPEERKAIVQIRANTADFGPKGFTRFTRRAAPGIYAPARKGSLGRGTQETARRPRARHRQRFERCELLAARRPPGRYRQIRELVRKIQSTPRGLRDV
jgi:hypothetical protein